MLAASFVVVDLLFVNVNQSSLAPQYASALTPSDAAAVAALAGDGRVLVVDPRLADGLGLARIGAPDLGVPDRLPEAGGYGSLMWGPYAAATGTHTQDGALPAALGNGTFSDLGVSAMLTLPSQLVVTGTGSSANRLQVGPETPVRRWFGQQVDVSELELSGGPFPGPAPAPASLQALAATVHLLGSGGTVEPARAQIHLVVGAVSISFATPVPAFGMTIGGLGATPLTIAEPVVRAGDRATFVTAGPLAAALGAVGWAEVGSVGGFSAFVNRRAAAPFTLSSPGSSWTVVSSDEWTGAVSVRVTTTEPATLVRSTAAVPGWQATVAHDGRLSTSGVGRHGLVQQVVVPAGASTVTFFYVAPGWSAGQLAALGGVVVIAALVVADVVVLRRRRRLAKAGAGAGDGLSADGAPSPGPA